MRAREYFNESEVYISKMQFINDLNTNYVILSWVPALALVASLLLFVFSWLIYIF